MDAGGPPGLKERPCIGGEESRCLDSLLCDLWDPNNSPGFVAFLCIVGLRIFFILHDTVWGEKTQFEWPKSCANSSCTLGPRQTNRKGWFTSAVCLQVTVLTASLPKSAECYPLLLCKMIIPTSCTFSPNWDFVNHLTSLVSWRCK